MTKDIFVFGKSYLSFILQRHEPNAELRSQVVLSFEGFARLLMDKENFIFNHEEASNKVSAVTLLLSNVGPCGGVRGGGQGGCARI